MRFLSLFSGIEAASVAWEKLGWKCVAFSEIDSFPCALLAHYYPDTPNLGDVTKITEEQIKALGQIDLVVFGSPCQNLSMAGNRKGLQGQSSGLFYDAIRIINWARKHNGARFALWENVTGAFSSNQGNDFTEVVRTLSGNADINTPKNGWGNTGVALGENGLVEWRTFDAQYFGLAQRRKRVFALTDFGAWQDRPPILIEPESVQGDYRESKKARDSLVASIRKGIKPSDLSEITLFETRYDDKSVETPNVAVSPTLTAAIGTSGSNNINLAYSIFGDTTPKIHQNIVGTLRANGGSLITPPCTVYGFTPKFQNDNQELSQTLTASDYKDPKCVIENCTIRRLTPTECERLMGFNDGWTDITINGKNASKSARYKALGNSIAVPVLEWIGRRIQWSVEPKSQNSSYLGVVK